jgi:hypothetical protein
LRWLHWEILQPEIFEALDREQRVVGVGLQVTQLHLDGVVRLSKFGTLVVGGSAVFVSGAGRICRR